mgnify:CR=1 FL=1
MILDPKIPDGPLPEKWERRRQELMVIGPANRRKYRIIVIGSGLAGASAAASLGELGYHVDIFCANDSPRRAHSVAAQGGINAAKNYVNDNDSVWRLFYDTIKGGDFRSREANVYRLAQLSGSIIDQCVAQGVPFARDYAGYLENRSFGGALVSRTFYARGQTGQQLLLAAYGALMRQVGIGTVILHPRTEMLDLVIIDGIARGVTVRNLISGEVTSCAADAVVLCSGGYSNVFFLSTNSINGNVTAAYRAYKKGAFFANPCFTQIHPTCIPAVGPCQSKLTLMSESLRNDGRVWVPKSPGDARHPNDIPEKERDYFLERMYPAYGNLTPRDIASRAVKAVCDEGRGVGPGGRGVYLDLKDAIKRLGKGDIRDRYGNLFDMYERITGENAYEQPMRIYPAPHYAMGGLWVDYNLMSSIPGLFVLGEANFSDHGANRLGASALMQGLADGYFIIPYTIADYLCRTRPHGDSTSHPEFAKSRQDSEYFIRRLLSIRGRRTISEFHRDLGEIMWNHVGMERSADGLDKAIGMIESLRQEFWENALVPGNGYDLNQELEKAGRVADFLEFAELMAIDALHRNESCGAHFRIEHQTPEGNPVRNDAEFSYVAAWEYNGPNRRPSLHKEPLIFEYTKPEARSYK